MIECLGGEFGQFCIVLPEQDAVIAITANTRDMQAELNIVWDKLLPEFGEKPKEENSDEQAKLKAIIAKLKASRTVDQAARRSSTGA